MLFPRPKTMGFASPYARRLPPVFELDVPWPLQTSTPRCCCCWLDMFQVHGIQSSWMKNFHLTHLLCIYGGFLKWWYPTTMGFPARNDHFGVFWGYHHLMKHPSYYSLFDIPQKKRPKKIFLKHETSHACVVSGGMTSLTVCPADSDPTPLQTSYISQATAFMFFHLPWRCLSGSSLWSAYTRTRREIKENLHAQASLYYYQLEVTLSLVTSGKCAPWHKKMGIYWLLTIKWCTQGSYQKKSCLPYLNTFTIHHPKNPHPSAALYLRHTSHAARHRRQGCRRRLTDGDLNICSTFLVGPKDLSHGFFWNVAFQKVKTKKKTTSGETKRILIVLILPTRKMHNLFGKKNSKITIDLHQVCSLSKWVLSNLIISVSSEGFFGSSPNVSGTKNAGILYLIQ